MSFYADTYNMKEGTPFRNVVGSTDDPKMSIVEYGTGRTIARAPWLSAWSYHKCGVTSWRCACCHHWAEVGGHIVLGDGSDADDAPVDKDSLRDTNRVFIIPLCKSCNNQERVLYSIYQVQIIQLWAFGSDGTVDGSYLALDETVRTEREFRRRYEEEKMRHDNWVAAVAATPGKLHPRDKEILRNSSVSGPSHSSSVSLPAYQ